MKDIVKTMSHWRDLEPYGIKLLTGEACALSMRYLCDLTVVGVHWIGKTLGMTALDPGRFPSNWNSASEEFPAVASVMLPHEMFVPIAVVILHSEGYDMIAHLKNGSVIGVMRDGFMAFVRKDWADLDGGGQLATFRDCFNLVYGAENVQRFYYVPDGTPHAGDRNVHMMSGRTA